VLTKESFQGLFLLQSLHITDLSDLKRFEISTFSFRKNSVYTKLYVIFAFFAKSNVP
jgi:hypothetical protein